MDQLKDEVTPSNPTLNNDCDSFLDRFINTREQSTLTDVSFMDLDEDFWDRNARLALLTEIAREGTSQAKVVATCTRTRGYTQEQKHQ